MGAGAGVGEDWALTLRTGRRALEQRQSHSRVTSWNPADDGPVTVIQRQEKVMKLRAHVTIDTDCRGQVEADEFEKRIEALVAELGQEFLEVQYGIKVRRAPKQKP